MKFTEIFRKRRLRKDACDMGAGILPLSSMHSVAVLMDGTVTGVDACTKMLGEFCSRYGLQLRLQYADMRKGGSKIQMMTDPLKTLLRKDLNWYGCPKLHRRAEIVGEPVDLYICLYDSDVYFVKYLSSTVKAKFKVGVREYPGDPFNIVVSPSGESPEPMDVGAVFLKIKNLLESVH